MGRFYKLSPTETQSQFVPLPIEFMYQTIKEKQSEIDSVHRASDIFKNSVKWGRATEKEGKELTEWLKEKTADVEKSIVMGDYQTAVNKLAQYNKELKSDWRWHKATQDFHYRDEVDKLLKEAQQKGDIPTFIDPATGGIRQMEGQSFNPHHYSLVPYSDYWGEEFDPQITDKLTASIRAYLQNPNVKIETLYTPDGNPIYGYYDPVKMKYEYITDSHPAVAALFGIDENGKMNPDKAVIKNLYNQGVLGQSKGFNFLKEAYKQRTGKDMPYEYFYNQAYTRVLPKFHVKEDISGGDFNILPEFAQPEFTEPESKNTRVLTNTTPVDITENNLTKNINNYKDAIQNFDLTQREVAGIAFESFVDFIDLQKQGIDILNYKGVTGSSPSLIELFNYYTNKYNIPLDINSLHKDKFEALFASLDVQEQEKLINSVNGVLTDALKQLDLTDPKQAQTADNIQNLLDSFNSYQSSLNNLASAGNIIDQNFDHIKESLEKDLKFDQLYREYEKTTDKPMSKPEFINLFLSDPKSLYKEKLSLADWLSKNIARNSDEIEIPKTSEDIILETKNYILRKFKDGSFATDEDVQYLYTKTGEKHPIVKTLENLEEIKTVDLNEKFYLKGNNTSKISASSLKDIKVSNIGFAGSKTDNMMNIYVTYEGKSENDNTYIKTVKKPFKPTQKNRQLYEEIVDILITQPDANKQAEGYRMYANMNNEIPKLAEALYMANKSGNENKETTFPVINHNGLSYQIIKVKGDISGQPGNFYVLVSKDGGKTYGVVTKDGNISTLKKLSEYKANTNVITQSNGQLYQDGNQALSIIGKFMYMTDKGAVTNNQTTNQSGGSGGTSMGKQNQGLSILQ